MADIIHDLPFPDKAIQCLANIIKPGGHFSLLDFDINSELKDNLSNPFGVAFYTSSLFYCLSCSLHGGGEGAGTCHGKQNLEKGIIKAGLEFGKIHSIPESKEIHFTCMKPL